MYLSPTLALAAIAKCVYKTRHALMVILGIF